MKILLILLFTLFSNADYLAKDISNFCVYDLIPNNNSVGVCFKYSHHIQYNSYYSYCRTDLKLSDFVDGYEYRNRKCLLKNDLKITGLTNNQLNYQFALMGNFMGFSFLILILFLTILVSRK